MGVLASLNVEHDDHHDKSVTLALSGHLVHRAAMVFPAGLTLEPRPFGIALKGHGNLAVERCQEIALMVGAVSHLTPSERSVLRPRPAAGADRDLDPPNVAISWRHCLGGGVRYTATITGRGSVVSRIETLARCCRALDCAADPDTQRVFVKADDPSLPMLRDLLEITIGLAFLTPEQREVLSEGVSPIDHDPEPEPAQEPGDETPTTITVATGQGIPVGSVVGINSDGMAVPAGSPSRAEELAKIWEDHDHPDVMIVAGTIVLGTSTPAISGLDEVQSAVMNAASVAMRQDVTLAGATLVLGRPCLLPCCDAGKALVQWANLDDIAFVCSETTLFPVRTEILVAIGTNMTLRVTDSEDPLWDINRTLPAQAIRSISGQTNAEDALHRLMETKKRVIDNALGRFRATLYRRAGIARVLPEDS